ncbi:MAG: hypothetical protein IJ389_05560 [Clostridia bacterium]|nr:hypothetical protein [Clostridia bacterium]
MKKILLTTLSLVLVAALAIGGTLAYLTDRDAKTNVFTIGNVDIRLNEDFAHGSELIPGVDITKKPTITNTGKNDAWVWATIAIPAALDSDDASKNVVHFNYNADSVAEGKWNWMKDGEWNIDTVTIDGVKYNLYIVCYDTVLTPGVTTEDVIYKVYMDDHIDIDPEGNLAHVENGEVTPLEWNINEDGNPIIFVNAYACQVDSFATALEAVEAYKEQWAGLNGDYAPYSYWDGASADFAMFCSLDADGEPVIGADGKYVVKDADEYVITSAAELAAFAKLVDAGETFEGKTVTLGNNIDLAGHVFDPIGSYRNDAAFKGTFDGRGYTIANMSQNTWALDNGYYYDDLGLGLFGLVENATIKNLVMDNASISGENGLCGTVAATAYGDCTFENITVKNSDVADYQYYAGGIVGWASGDHKYINCNIDESTVIGGQWGDFGNASGGIIGGAGASGNYYMKDCTVACRIDAVNDVVSAYQWYAYRNCGMLIGRTGHTATDDAVTNAAAPNLTCENVTVIYGDWANYTYCEFAGTGYPYVRVQAGTSVDAYTNIRYGHPTDANGNTVVDDNHVHNAGEDHHVLLVFDQLYGGPADHRYCTYGVATHDGVTVIYNNK